MKRMLVTGMALLLLLPGCGSDETEPQKMSLDVEKYRRAPAPVQELEPVFAPVATNDPDQIVAMGERYYQRGCADCHDRGLAGALVLGDVVAWQPLLEKGLTQLVFNAINGIGEMPPRGGDPGLRKEAVGMVVEYMVNQAQ